VHTEWDNEPTLPVARSSIAVPACTLESKWGKQTFSAWPVRIGKDPGNDYVIDHPSCSRLHAAIHLTATGFAIQDLESTNGVFVKGVRVKEAWIDPGAELALGEAKVAFGAGNELHEIKPIKKERLGEMVGRSDPMRRLFDLVQKIAGTDATVLLMGETGTGKEVLARTIHSFSRRSAAPLSVIDCSAIPQSLVESELFGHEKGAFTGALAVRKGLFESANGGTVLLDEIGELPLSIQPKLLRVLETGQFRRVGSSTPIRCDVRLIAATNRNLYQEADQGRFRRDLLYRLNVIPITIPPLRERLEDIEPLVEHILDRLRLRHRGEIPVVEVAPSFIQQLRTWHFPGNIRELCNIMEREVALASGPVLTRMALPPGHLSTSPNVALHQEEPPCDAPSCVDPLESSGAIVEYRQAKESTLTEFHIAYLTTLMRHCRGSISAAARTSGMDRKVVRLLLRDLGLHHLTASEPSPPDS